MTETILSRSIWKCVGMGVQVRVGVLGPVAVFVGGQSVDVGGPRQRQLLAALAIDAGVPVAGDALIDRLWADGGLPSDPRGAVRTYLARLRQALGAEDAVVTESSGWRLNTEVVELDAIRFGALVDAAEEPGLEVHRRLGLLDEGLALWRGEAFGEVAGEEWARAEADRLNELRVTVVERRYDAMLSAGMHTDALPGLVGAIEAHPLRDRLVGLHMLALFRSGRQAEATRVFQDHRQHLGEELGLEPGAELVELDGRIVAGDPSLLMTSNVGRALRGYRLGEQLGEGAFAVVYRGTQPSLGRDVAVKVIRAELANRPEFVRRFEAEAHLVARLEHPYIVPLYDYWREPDRACLVFRYLRGGTLEQRLSSTGGLSIAECRMLVDEVGDALSTAHAAGVVHRDVKPANVLLDEAGNFYLGDFGIALEAAELSDPTAALSAGSPAYASPEQLRQEVIGPPADIHGLGISIFEALTGSLPFPSAITHVDLLQRQLQDPIPSVRDRRSDVPPAVDNVLARATAKDPADRYQTIDELVTDFRAAFDADPAALVRAETATKVTLGEARNPYKGLRAFTEADSGDFFGRERLVDRLVDVLSRSGTEGRIAAVVGPSGIGKSSVVRAGLLPALRDGAVAGSGRWFVATMLPGRDPFEELGAALLRVATRAPDNMMAQLAEDHRGIARVVKAIAPDDDLGDVLLVIDQFEELFTLSQDETITRLFLDSLEHAVTDARCPLRVILTMRADFWDRPLRHGSFARLIDASTINVTALAPDELERAIVEPAHRAGAEFEPGLVSEMVAGLTDQPGALPLLQYALTELWEQQISGLLTRDAYHRLGGIAGALSRRAEDLYLDATPQEQAAIRPLFGRLVTPGEGAEDTRRRALLAEVALTPEAGQLIDRYGQARLLSFDHDPTTREPTIEVAHEALIRQWPRLREWLDEDRDDLRVLRHLSVAADDWHVTGRSAAELYRGGRLEMAEDWAARHSDDMTDLERTFLTACIEARSKDERDERQRFERQTRDNRRLKMLLSAVAVVAAAALISGAVAFQQRARANENAGELAVQVDVAARSRDEAVVAQGDAEQARDEAETRRLIADAAALADEDPTVALLLAAQAGRREPGPRTAAGLQQVLTSLGPHLGTVANGEDVLAASWVDAERLAAVFDQTLVIYDLDKGEVLTQESLPRPPEQGLVHQFSQVMPSVVAQGETVAVALSDGSVAILDGTPMRVIEVTTESISALALAGNGTQLLIADTAGGVSRHDLGNDSLVWRSQVLPESSMLDVMAEDVTTSLLEAGVDLARFDDLYFGSGPLGIEELDSGDIAVAAGVHVRRLSGDDGNVLDEYKLEAEWFPGLPAFPRWARGLDQASDGTLHVELGITPGWVEIPPGFGEPIFHIGEVERLFGDEWLTDLTVAPSGRVWFANLLGRFVQVDGREAGAPMIADIAELRFLAVSPDEDEVLLIGDGGIVRRSLNGDQLLARAAPLGASARSVTISGDGGQLIVDSTSDAPSRVVDINGPVPTETELGDDLATSSLWMGNDPLDRFVHAWQDCCELRVLDRRTFRETGLVIPSAATGESYSHDGRYVAFGDSGNTIVQVYDLETDEQISPDLDLNELMGTNGSNVSSIDFSPDGTRMISSIRADGASGTGEAIIFDTSTWQPVSRLEASDLGGAATAVYMPDGQLVTVGSDGSIVVRDPDTLEPRTVLEGGTEAANVFVAGPFVSGDGEYLLTMRYGAPRLWHLPSGSLVGSFPHDATVGIGGSGAGEQLRLVTALENNALVWNLDVDRWLDIACRAAGRNLTQNEWETLGPKGEPYASTCPRWASGPRS